MGNTYILRKGVAGVQDLKGGFGLMGLGMGNVYRVIASDEPYYTQFVADHQFEHSDGSEAVHTTIASALSATVECRNDYVVVQPQDADYDITTALEMNKKSVHLVCPAGLGYDIGASNACRIHQTGAYPIINVSDAAIEIAGFYLKNYATKGGVILSSDVTYGLMIHHNYWAMSLSGSTNEPMLGPLIANTTGAAGAWGTFERNFFQSQAGGSATIAAILGTFNAQATGVRVCFNELAIGDTNNTATVGIKNLSVKGITRDNIFHAHQTASGAGVFTHCVQTDTSGTAYRNIGNVADGEIVVGGTDELSHILNYNSVGGGTQDEL